MVSRLRADLAQEWAQELFTLSFQAREDLRAFVQNDAMAILARLDPDRALEMLHSMSPEELQGTMTTTQLELARYVFQLLVERDGVSALPVLEEEAALMGAQGPYPYAALGYAADQATLKDWGSDNQHAIQVLQSVFEPAFARYRQNAHGFIDDIEFGKMLEVLAGGLPFDSLQPALRLLVKNLVATNARKYESEAEVHTNDGKSAKVDNTIDAAILSFGTLINRDPELAQQLKSTRPELQTALEYTKEGRQSGMSLGARQPQNLAPADPSEELHMEAIRLSHIDAEAAIAKAERLPVDGRASTMLEVAREIACDHPERAAELIVETQRGNQTNGDAQLNLISAQASLAAAQHNTDDLHQLLGRGFDAANQLVSEQQRMSNERLPAGLAPLVQIGIQNDLELTTAFIEGLPASYAKASLLLVAASALGIHKLLPLSSRPQQRAEKPNQ